MAEKDIIARLKVEGQVEFTKAIVEASQSTSLLYKNLANTVDELDGLSSALVDTAITGKHIVATFTKLDKAVESTASSMDDINNSASKVEKDLDKINKRAKEGSNAIDGFNSEMSQTSTIIDSVGSSAKDANNDIYNLGATFEEIYGTVRPLTTQLGEMEDRMYQLALAGKQNTEEYKALQQETIRFRRAQLEVDASVDAFADRGAGIEAVGSAISGLAGAFEVGQGAIALFGEESETLNQALIKLNGVMAISSGIQQVNEALLKRQAITTRVMAVAQSAYGLAVGTSTGALRIFRLALVATGIGALVVLLGAIIANWDKLSKAIVNAVPGLKNFGETWNKVKDNVKGFFQASIQAAILYGNTIVNLGKVILAALTPGKSVREEWNNLIQDAKNGINDIANAYQNGKEASKQQRLEDQRRNEILYKISKLENDILKAKAGNASESKVLSLELQKARAELSLLAVGSKEYYEKQIEINGITKSMNDLLKSNTKEIKEQVFGVALLQEQYNKLLETANKSPEGSKEYVESLRQASQLIVKLEKAQERLNNALNQGREIQLDIIKQTKLEQKENKNKYDGIIQGEIAGIEARKKANESIYANIAREKEERQKVFEDNLKNSSEQIAIANQVGQAAFDIFRSFNDLQRALLERRLADGLISQEEYNKELAKLQEKQAKQDKAMAIFKASIDGAQAIIAALTVPPPLGQILAGIIGATVALQIAAIAATPIPKFFKGVIGLKRGSNPKGRDTIPAMLNEGESVMTTEETKKHRPVLEAIRNKTFDKMYVKTSAFNQRNLSPIMQFVGGKSDKKTLKKLDAIMNQLENINSNTHFGANGTNQLNKLLKKRNSNGKFFV